MRRTCEYEKKKSKYFAKLLCSLWLLPKACPKDAISITKGIYAVVDKNKCIGCGLCEKACPASIIRMEELS